MLAAICFISNKREEKKMLRLIKNTFVLLVLLLLFVVSTTTWAAPTIDSDEATYVANLVTIGFVSTTETFEDDSFWGLLEPASRTTVPSVTSQGVR